MDKTIDEKIRRKKELKRIQNQKYRAKHREEINAKAKQYRDKHKEKIYAYRNQKFNCECGGKYTLSGRSHHYKTLKHKKYLEELDKQNDLKTNELNNTGCKTIEGQNNDLTTQSHS